MKTNETYLPLKRPSAGPFFKSTLAEIYFTIYNFMADGEKSPRDASAASLYASALLELSGYVDKAARNRYIRYATDILRSLSGAEYTAAPGTNGRFLLRHATTSFPTNKEVDKPLNYADYYYLEALLRLRAILSNE